MVGLSVKEKCPTLGKTQSPPRKKEKGTNFFPVPPRFLFLHSPHKVWFVSLLFKIPSLWFATDHCDMRQIEWMSNLVPRALRVRSSRRKTLVQAVKLQILLARGHGNASVFKMALLNFLRSVDFSVRESGVSVNLKVSQVRASEAVYLGKDVLAVLPTGYGKSLIFQLLPNLIAFKKHMLRCTSGTVTKDCVA